MFLSIQKNYNINNALYVNGAIVKNETSENFTEWFKKTSDFPNLLVGLKKVGFNKEETSKIMGLNWLNFYEKNFHAL